MSTGSSGARTLSSLGADRTLPRLRAATYARPMSENSNALGTYLRARRELVKPEQAGIPHHGVRRVPGLRREEVAMLAGISADYYLRLERGRDRNPSVQVLESIARVLRLDDDHVAHLLSLVTDLPRQRKRRPPKETVPPNALMLLQTLTQPAFIEGRYFDILASNSFARVLDPALSVGGNQLRGLFLDADQQSLYPDWEKYSECLIANLRQAVGTDTDDPRFVDLVGELSLASPLFRRLWARHEVRGQRGATMRLEHPQVGELVLNRERLSVGGAENLKLVIFHPEPGSEAAEKLALLLSASLPLRPHNGTEHAAMTRKVADDTFE